MKLWRARFQASLAGLSAEEIALLISIGLVLGVFPISGFPTVFCLLAALGLRLNVAALQLVNQASSPLQIALLVPLVRVGERLCGGTASRGGGWMDKAGGAALHAVTGWASICIPLGVLLYVSLLIAMRRGLCRPATTI